MADHPLTDPADIAPAATAPSDPRGRSEDAAADSTDVAALQRERDDVYDRLLRKTAEFENYRRRVERERREQGDRAIADLLQELLLVVDDFDRALMADEGTESHAAYRKGVEMIHAKLHELLRKHKVKPIEAVGKDFDPTIHQAVVHEVSPEHREGEVIEELRRGYMMGDRLLRPALVKVAKA